MSPKVHWSVVINLLMDRAHIEGVQRRVLVGVDEKLQKWQPFVNSWYLIKSYKIFDLMSRLHHLNRDFPRDAPRAIGALESKLAPWAKNRGARGRPRFLSDAPYGLSLKCSCNLNPVILNPQHTPVNLSYIISHYGQWLSCNFAEKIIKLGFVYDNLQ